MNQVTIIAIPRALGSTVTIPLEMLSAANDIARARKQRDKLLRIELIGLEHGSVGSSEGHKTSSSFSLVVSTARTWDTSMRAAPAATALLSTRRGAATFCSGPRLNLDNDVVGFHVGGFPNG